MTFSARQLHCLQAMGLVPWVLRNANAEQERTAAVAKSATPARESERPVSVSGVRASGRIEAKSQGVRSRNIETGLTAGQAAADSLPSSTTYESEMSAGDTEQSAIVGPGTAQTQSEAEPVVSSPASVAANHSERQPPTEISVLAPWLQSRSLVPIVYRGAHHPALGRADTSLLVVLAHQSASPETGVLAGDEARLFELMLLSIGLRYRDTRQCLVGEPGKHSRNIGIDTLINGNTRGLLFPVESWPFDSGSVALEQHRTPYSAAALPLWRIPHPGVLLREPQLKRQAWQVLKQLRAELRGQGY